jgi:hypothetical protein
MTEREHLKHLVAGVIEGNVSFDYAMCAVHDFQLRENSLYYRWTELISRVDNELPCFLPVEMFKRQAVMTGNFDPEVVFVSSGTSGEITSRHFVREASWYLLLSEACFKKTYGNPENYCFLCLLPSYLERQGSSLIFMAEHFIRKSRYEQSGFYLHADERLVARLKECGEKKIPTILLGVSFALLDFAEKNPIRLEPALTIMETGGMKGRRKEWVREELHAFLTSRFGVNTIHSEYGMTELLSQAYSIGHGIYFPPPHMKVIITDVNDPTQAVLPGKTGLVNLIDLGNIDSCAFIATQDLGRAHPDGSFEILGRYDYGDIRGCNLLIA